MKFSHFEERLKKKLEESIPGATPGVMVQVHQNGKKVADVSAGSIFMYYDLASLTKVIFTVQAMAILFQNQKWNLETSVKDILPWFPHKQIFVRDLLTHSSGLPWWIPFYREVDLHKSLPERWEQLKFKLSQAELTASDTSVYSDVGFWVLAYILEELYQKSLFEIWKEIKTLLYPGLTLDLHPDNQAPHPQHYYAPTERCPWRKRLLQGEVHDDNCWALGGVSTHAGLFGSIDDVGWFSLFVRAQLLGLSKTMIKQKTAQLFCSRMRPTGKGDWAMGYMMVTPGKSSSGDYFSALSVGHTGFTGTSFWYDPSQDLSVSIVSNRVMFGSDKKDFAELRPKIHNWVVELLKRT